VSSLDPYAELGVPKDASTVQVRRAYRARAKKVHPDAGGSAPEFERARRAMIVLTDPVKRERFDRDGHIDEDRPDNARGNALQVIEQFVAGVLDAYVKTMQNDPRHRDLMKEFRAKMDEEIGGLAGKIAVGRQVQEFVRDMASRFSTDDPLDPIGRGFDRKLQEIETNIAAMEGAKECRKLAAEIAATYSFRMDAPPQYAPQGFTIFRGQT